MDSLRDLDYLRDRDGIVLLVKGDHHPKGRARAYPVFWPDPAGERVGSARYRKETNDCDNTAYLKLAPGSYDEDLPGVPSLDLARVVARYRPTEAGLAHLEGRWHDLAQGLLGLVPREDIGIIGSALVGLDRYADGRRVKDVDFAVFGRKSRELLRAGLAELREQAGATPISPAHIAYQAGKFGRWFQPGLNSWEKLLARKWSSLQLAPGLLATVRFGYQAREVMPDPLASPVVARQSLRGRVVEDEDVDFMPRRFVVRASGERVAVASLFWGHQSCVRMGDQVVVVGDRRADGTLTVTRLDHGIRIED